MMVNDRWSMVEPGHPSIDHRPSVHLFILEPHPDPDPKGVRSMSTGTAKFPTAAEVMTAGPRTCSTFSTVLEAVLIFRDADCGAVPVLDDGKPVGLLTDRDVALGLAEHGENLGLLPVTELMTHGVVAVSPDRRHRRDR